MTPEEQEKIAKEVKAAALALNMAVDKASTNGLRIEFDLTDVTVIGQERRLHLSVDVLKRL